MADQTEPDQTEPDATGSTFKPWITEPGVYDLPAETYHRDPVVGGSLSNTGAKKLLTPNCPAIFKAWIDGRGEPETKKEFDFGRAAHRHVLSAGDDTVVIAGDGADENAWRTKSDKARVAEVRAAGKTPVKPNQVEQIEEMAAAIRANTTAAALLDPASGKAEQTLVMRDPKTGVWCRALVDWLRHPEPAGRLLLVDYKTAAEVDPESIAKAIASYGYFKQGPWYMECAEQLGLSAVEPAFLFIFQRKTAPYLVTVTQLTPEDVARGREAAAGARELYAWCRRTGRWPGYGDEVLSVPMAFWARTQHDEAAAAGAFHAPEEIPA